MDKGAWGASVTVLQKNSTRLITHTHACAHTLSLFLCRVLNYSYCLLLSLGLKLDIQQVKPLSSLHSLNPNADDSPIYLRNLKIHLKLNELFLRFLLILRKVT